MKTFDNAIFSDLGLACVKLEVTCSIHEGFSDKMLISLEHRLAFLAVPKTGSTAIEAAFAPYCDISFGKNPQIKHMTAKRFYRHMRPYLSAMGHEGVEICSVIREPIDWLGSWYRYRSRDQIAGQANSTAGISFEDFACAYMEDPKPSFATVGQQSVFLSLPDGAEPITHLFAYETMDAFQAFLSERLGKAISFETRNQSPPGDLTLSGATKSQLEQFFAQDYALWENARRNP